MARLKKTVGFGELAGRVLGRADRNNKRAGAAAVNAWNEIVGDEIAKRTRGFALRDNGELVVSVASSAWANQLSLMSQELMERLNEHCGENQVTSLRFTVSRRAAAKTLAATPLEDTEMITEHRAPVALDDIERAQAEQVASAIKDEALRAVALRVMIKDLELKKGARRKPPETGS